MSASTTGDEREYVLGTDDAELVRLGFQHQVWAEPTTAAWERAGFRPGDRLLDLGCGPGYATFDLARLVGPRGSVLGVDVSTRFLGHLERERAHRTLANVETRHAELEALDLPTASFDGAFARWVLCFVRDPAAVMANVARALRPGAPFVVLDYTRYSALTISPRSEAIERVIEAVNRSFIKAGGDPDVGRRLPTDMHRAGLEVRSIRPLVRVARPGSALWEWPATFFANYLPFLVAAGEIGEEDRTAFERDWAERSRSPGAFLLTPPMIELIGVRRAD